MSLSGIALVTGGAGFIGSHIAAALTKSGARVRIVDNLSTGYRENIEEIPGEIDFIQADVGDQKALDRALEDVELVFHEAALPSVPRSIEDPRRTHLACVDATFSLLVSAKEHRARRIIYAGSSSAYGDQTKLLKSEDILPDPLSPYAVAKLVGEYYCQVFTRVYGLETLTLRYFNVFGPRQDPSSQYSGVISRFISALLTGERPVIYGDGEQSRDFTYIDNVVTANLKAAETSKGLGQIINIANGKRISLNQLLQELSSLTGRSGVTPDYQPTRAGDVKHSLADISRARELLAYEPHVDLRTGLQKTIDWWKLSRFAQPR